MQTSPMPPRRFRRSLKTSSASRRRATTRSPTWGCARRGYLRSTQDEARSSHSSRATMRNRARLCALTLTVFTWAALTGSLLCCVPHWPRSTNTSCSLLIVTTSTRASAPSTIATVICSGNHLWTTGLCASTCRCTSLLSRLAERTRCVRRSAVGYLCRTSRSPRRRRTQRPRLVGCCGGDESRSHSS